MFSNFQFQFGFMFPEINRNFSVSYYCYSVAMLPGNERQDVERGGKSEYMRNGVLFKIYIIIYDFIL